MANENNIEPHKVLTYAQIKEFVNKMDEVQLQQSVYAWISDNENATEINDIDELGDDTYYFTDHEYSCTRKDFMKDVMVDDETDAPLYQTIDEAIAAEEHIVTKANRVYLYSFD